jgi:hypothetical protein
MIPAVAAFGRTIARRCLTAVVPYIFLLLTGSASKAVSNFCPSGTCDIANPVFVNVYWDSSEAQWNSDIKATDPSATVFRLEAITVAICRSSYFSQMTQYSIQSCSILPGLVEAGCGPPPPDLDQAHSHIVDFATCVMTSLPALDPGSTILNVLLPPQTVPASPTAHFCSASNGQHDKYGSPVEVTFIPTNAACNSNIASITGALTHEMVEATTDPVPASPTEWKVPFKDGEIADLCENSQFRYRPFLYGLVSEYFSNSPQNGCDPGELVLNPNIAKVTACGSGHGTRISISGTLYSPPWDLVNDANGSTTMFLQAAVSGSHSFSAGGITNFPPDLVKLGHVTWSPADDSVVIDGFGAGCGVSRAQCQP